VTYDNVIVRMCIACWITKARDEHSEYVLLLFMTTMVTRTLLNITFILKLPVLLILFSSRLIYLRNELGYLKYI